MLRSALSAGAERGVLGQWAPGPGGPQPGQEGEDEAARGPPWPPHSSQRRAAARSPAPAMPPERCPRRSAALRLPARHRGRVLLKAADQWARCWSLFGQWAHHSAWGAGGPGRGGAGSRPPSPCPPLGSGALRPPLIISVMAAPSSLAREVAGLKSQSLREALDGPRSRSGRTARVHSSSFIPRSFCPSSQLRVPPDPGASVPSPELLLHGPVPLPSF